jgi:diacylglycerol O-acyltransferase / wax synthase
MQQLTGLDASFLAMETPGVYGHVGSICVLDPSTAPQPLTLARLTEVIDSRLHLVPPFRRRLAEVPFGLDQPYWVEDPDFDIEFHVRELALAPPGNDGQLAELAARLHARQLDRTRPLWELYLISGLAGGRMAIYTKVHHAAIDGVSGNDIIGALMDLEPAGRDLPPAPAWLKDTAPSQVGLLLRSMLAAAGQPVRAVRMSTALLKSLPALAQSPVRPRLPVLDSLILRRNSDTVLPQSGLRAPKTPFNRPISPHRRWAFRTLPLDTVKAVKSATGSTVNDVVMTLCAAALRRWLTDHHALPDQPLIAAVPISVRTDSQQGALGNRVSMMIAPLPTNVDDPAARLQLVHEAMRAAKDQHGALPADSLADVAQFAMPALAGQAARVAARLRLLERMSPFNLIISNVPGPNVPLYYAGAELVGYYPLSAITDGQGLNITVMSYRGGLHFGVIACRELVPDVERIVDYLADELATLAALLPAADVPTPRRASNGRATASGGKRSRPPAG